jgi:hypothetical protein
VKPIKVRVKHFPGAWDFPNLFGMVLILSLVNEMGQGHEDS